MGRQCANTPSRDTEPLEDSMLVHDTSVRITLRARDGSVRAYAVVDADDAGWVNHWQWQLQSNGYAVRGGMGGAPVIYLHRALMGLQYGDGFEIDHIDHDRLNNRRANLRIVTRAENGQNRHGKKNVSSRFRGVSRHTASGLWRARVSVNRREHAAYFATEEEAANAAVAMRLHLMTHSVEES